MANAIKKLLFDILQSIERINQYTESPKQFTFTTS
jgi:uncharacterized protein with HEPN domain